MSQQRIVVVTGGGSGIGAAIARNFAATADVVYIVGRRLEICAALVADIAATGGTAYAQSLDICDSSAVDLFVDAVVARHGRLDVLVANAGLAAAASVDETDDALLEALCAVNVRGTFACCRAAFRVMREQRGGSIITMGSVVSHRGYAQQAAYGATKHAVLGFTKALCVEAQEFGVRVACVMPGGVATEMVRATRPDLDGAQMIQPQDVASAVRYLVDLPAHLAIDEIRLRRWAAAP